MITVYDAYALGYACGLNGPNETNSHYKIFSSPELTTRWEEGKRDGSTAKERLEGNPLKKALQNDAR